MVSEKLKGTEEIDGNSRLTYANIADFLFWLVLRGEKASITCFNLCFVLSVSGNMGGNT